MIIKVTWNSLPTFLLALGQAIVEQERRLPQGSRTGLRDLLFEQLDDLLARSGHEANFLLQQRDACARSD